jgi:hypothetical protein
LYGLCALGLLSLSFRGAPAQNDGMQCIIFVGCSFFGGAPQVSICCKPGFNAFAASSANMKTLSGKIVDRIEE